MEFSTDRGKTIIISKDDATRNVMACRVCERETLVEHYAALVQMFAHVGIPQALYTDAFTMFGKAGEDLKSKFGRICRAFGILHLVAPTPQAKGKLERDMRTSSMFSRKTLIPLQGRFPGGYRVRHGYHSKLPHYREFMIYCSRLRRSFPPASGLSARRNR